MAEHKPQPLYHLRNQKHCPICGEVSYSAAGIHPQCAMAQADAQADAQRIQEAKPALKSPKKKARDSDRKPWQKKCPKCQALMHVRKKLCDCGYAFPGMGAQHDL